MRHALEESSNHTFMGDSALASSSYGLVLSYYLMIFQFFLYLLPQLMPHRGGFGLLNTVADKLLIYSITLVLL